MEQRTLDQNKKLHTLLSLLNIDTELKEELVLQFTNHRSKSSRDMKVDECARLISYLERMSGNMAERERITLMKMRYGLYYLLRDKGYLPSMDNKEAMEHLDNLCIKCWNTPASDMNEKRLGSILGIVRKWKQKKQYA
jgi:hypothetical protein